MVVVPKEIFFVLLKTITHCTILTFLVNDKGEGDGEQRESGVRHHRHRGIDGQEEKSGEAGEENETRLPRTMPVQHVQGPRR